MRSISIDGLKSFVLQVLEHHGMSAEDADTVAEVLVTTDSWGVSTHGTKALSGYATRLLHGGLKANARPKIDREGPAWAVVDADLAIGMVAGVYAMKVAIAKAKTSGIALVTVHNSCHFGAAGYYAYLAAKENLIGMAMANDRPGVAAPGSKGMVFGSNPIAFSAPGGSHEPAIFDISTAIVAGGKIRVAVAEGKPIPEGWLVDDEGKSTTDGTLYPYHAALLPMAGHKGYGIAMLIEILAGVLSGSGIRHGVGGWVDHFDIPTHHGHAFLAINPALFVGADGYNTRIDEMIDGIKQVPMVEGADPLAIPGEFEYRKRQAALKTGIPIPDDVLESLQAAAKQASIPLPPELA